MYYVIVIRENGEPGCLYGPMPFNDAVEKCVAVSRMEDTAELRQRITELCPISDDSLESPYIICAE